MTYAILIASKTGNTNLLAEQIFNVFPKSDCVYFGEARADITADVLFLGSWTDQGMLDEAILTVLKQLHHQTIVVFGTAGFGGSQVYFNEIMKRSLKDLSQTNVVLGTFMCQGKMPISVRKRYELLLEQEATKKQAMDMIENFDRALAHPDMNDLDAFVSFLQECKKQLSAHA